MIVAGLKEVIIYSSPDDKKKNRGFCFLEYESHKCASLAKRRLETGRVKVSQDYYNYLFFDYFQYFIAFVDFFYEINSYDSIMGQSFTLK